MCNDRDAFCRILQDTLQPLGFSGFRLENSNRHRLAEAMIVPLSYDAMGRMQYCWADGISANPDWELRLQLTTNSGQHLGYLCLIQLRESRSQFVRPERHDRRRANIHFGRAAARNATGTGTSRKRRITTPRRQAKKKKAQRNLNFVALRILNNTLCKAGAFAGGHGFSDSDGPAIRETRHFIYSKSGGSNERCCASRRDGEPTQSTHARDQQTSSASLRQAHDLLPRYRP